MGSADAARIGIDTGGTFTDGVRTGTGGKRSVKVPSTPDDPARAVRQALQSLGGLEGRGRLHHGSTVGTNAVLTRSGARVVLVTTRGFEDVLHLARGTRSDLHALAAARPAPLVAAADVVGVAERIQADGTVALPLSDAEIRRVVRATGELEPEAVAVCLLHALRSPGHERALARALRRALAGSGRSVHVAHELSADPREAERAETVVLDAFVASKVVSYVRRLARSLPAGALTVMRSDGGRMTLAEVRRAPVRTLLSGPAAGVAAAHEVARRLGLERALSFDVGGTSTDVAWIEGEAPVVREVLHLGEHKASVPSLALETVGAGGGSEVWLDAGGALRVGPRSAGALPGPACYGRGGPFTLTDAWLLLGRLPGALLGGDFPLDAGAAERAGRALAREAGTSLRALARGVVEVAAVTTARALRRASIAEGHDPRGAHLIAFGGAGPTLAARTADLLELASVVVPWDPGTLAAWGTLVAPLRADAGRVALGRDDAWLGRTGRTLAREVRARLERDGVVHPTLRVEVDGRYPGQAFDVTVAFGPGWRKAFHAAHAARFGFADAGRPVEAVRIRVRGHGGEGGEGPRRARPGRASARPRAARPHHSVRGVAFHRREDLAAGCVARGPAVVEERTATTWVPTGWRARVGTHLDLVLERGR